MDHTLCSSYGLLRLTGENSITAEQKHNNEPQVESEKAIFSLMQAKKIDFEK